MNELRKLEFLYQSIGDTRSTIRALDVKASFLLVVILIPVNKLWAIYSKIRDLRLSDSNSDTATFILIVGLFFTLAWALALWSTLRTLMGIYDPHPHIDGDLPKNYFFPFQLFSFGPLNVLFGGDARSDVQFSDYVKSIPEDDSRISQQLASEQVKLIYIAKLKSKRCQLAYWATLCWMVSGGILWLMLLLSN